MSNSEETLSSDVKICVEDLDDIRVPDILPEMKENYDPGPSEDFEISSNISRKRKRRNPNMLKSISPVEFERLMIENAELKTQTKSLQEKYEKSQTRVKKLTSELKKVKKKLRKLETLQKFEKSARSKKTKKPKKTHPRSKPSPPKPKPTPIPENIDEQAKVIQNEELLQEMLRKESKARKKVKKLKYKKNLPRDSRDPEIREMLKKLKTIRHRVSVKDTEIMDLQHQKLLLAQKKFKLDGGISLMNESYMGQLGPTDLSETLWDYADGNKHVINVVDGEEKMVNNRKIRGREHDSGGMNIKKNAVKIQQKIMKIEEWVEDMKEEFHDIEEEIIRLDARKKVMALEREFEKKRMEQELVQQLEEKRKREEELAHEEQKVKERVREEQNVKEQTKKEERKTKSSSEKGKIDITVFDNADEWEIIDEEEDFGPVVVVSETLPQEPEEINTVVSTETDEGNDLKRTDVVKKRLGDVEREKLGMLHKPKRLNKRRRRKKAQVDI